MKLCIFLIIIMFFFSFFPLINSKYTNINLGFVWKFIREWNEMKMNGIYLSKK